MLRMPGVGGVRAIRHQTGSQRHADARSQHEVRRHRTPGSQTEQGNGCARSPGNPTTAVMSSSACSGSVSARAWGWTSLLAQHHSRSVRSASASVARAGGWWPSAGAVTSTSMSSPPRASSARDTAGAQPRRRGPKPQGAVLGVRRQRQQRPRQVHDAPFARRCDRRLLDPAGGHGQPNLAPRCGDRLGKAAISPTGRLELRAGSSPRAWR